MDEQAIKKRIIEVCQRSLDLDYRSAADVAFHMTDWLKNMGKLHDFFSSPNNGSDEQVADMLTCFLIHAPKALPGFCGDNFIDETQV